MEIKIITVNNYFGQSLPTEISLNLNELQKKLNSYGYDTNIIDIQKLQFEVIDENTVYLCGSHQNRDVKKYISDCVSIIFQANPAQIIPSCPNLLAHDNKGIQALIAQKIGSAYFPEQAYYYRPEDINSSRVVKALAGAGSSGVELVSSSAQLEKTLRKISFYEYNINDILFLVKNLAKKFIFRSKLSAKFTEYNKKYSLYCLQEFFAGLKNDYKVLVFGSTVYVLERKVRDGSFKASGSGKFSYPEMDIDLLEFSHELREKLETPYVSLDVVKLKNGSYKCIEFQCVHFGPYTQINAKHKYTRNTSGDWVKQENDLTLEEVYAQSINEFIKGRVNL